MFLSWIDTTLESCLMFVCDGVSIHSSREFQNPPVHLRTPPSRARCVRAFTTAPESRAPHGLPVVLLRARPPALRGSRPPRPLIWARRAPAPAPLPALLPCRRPQSAWPPRLGSRAPRRQGRSAQPRPRGAHSSTYVLALQEIFLNSHVLKVPREPKYKTIFCSNAYFDE